MTYSIVGDLGITAKRADLNEAVDGRSADGTLFSELAIDGADGTDRGKGRAANQIFLDGGCIIDSEELEVSSSCKWTVELTLETLI